MTMETCDLLYINKADSMRIVKAGTEDQSFIDRLNFLLQIPLFQKINTNHLQPLISNLVVKTFRKGEYIQREGHEPEGLTIIREGYAMCVADKLSVRRVSKRGQKNVEDEGRSSEFLQNRPDVLKRTDSRRLFQNKRIYFDDNDEHGGHPNTIPSDYVVYKDLVRRLRMITIYKMMQVSSLS